MAEQDTQAAPKGAIVPQAHSGPDPVEANDHVFLIDGSGYIFRAYHALPPLTRKSDGLPVGAVSGFCNMLWKLLREEVEGVRPTHLAVVFDAGHVTFRNAIYDGYKAQRPPPPEDLVPQFALIRQAVEAFNLPCVEQDGFEADDLIATYAKQARARGADVTVVSSDKDLMQLVREGVVMWDPVKARRIDADAVMEKFGVAPDRVIDVQALAGDSVDNVPGVPGIGVKTAAQLVGEYGDLESLLERAGEIRQPKRRENLLAHAEMARVSKRLVTLEDDVPVEAGLADLAVREPDAGRLLAFLREMEFSTLTRRVADAAGMDAASAPAPRPAPAARAEPVEALTPAGLAEARAHEAREQALSRGNYECVTTRERLEAWIAEAREAGEFAFDTETDGLDAASASLVGFSLATAPGRAAYVPLRHRAGEGLDLAGAGDLAQIPVDEALGLLGPLLADPGVLKIGHNLKFDLLVCQRAGMELAAFDDTLLISYALDAGRGGHGMDELARRWLNHDCIAFKDVAGSGKAQVTFDLVPLDKAAEYAAEDADVTLRLHRVLKPRLAAEGLTHVYESLERPMVATLGAMEARGIAVDRQILSRFSGDFAQKMARLEAELHEIAGEPFNVGSPKQVGDILFGKFALPGGKKTKTGAWATPANALEELAPLHALPAKLLEWRQVAKLKSTYTDALPTYLNAETGRVHTSFALAATSTGRLSSSEPNLQNIPVRTEEGRKIRTAFVAPQGAKLMSADYSQIELRLLAHIADIGALKQAFSDGLDIHAMTASEMFATPIEGMDPMVRRRAKAINFGIIYGISAFGLANQLGIGREEARDYIARYFERFPGIRDYIEATKAEAREKGYVATVFGRRCHYPQIHAKSAAERAFNERAAINAPIQGSAADIIRRAMIRMDGALAEAGLDAKMLLQVHDELVFEVPDDQVEATIPVVTAVMVEAPRPVAALSVPLEVEARAAGNWEEAH